MRLQKLRNREQSILLSDLRTLGQQPLWKEEHLVSDLERSDYITLGIESSHLTYTVVAFHMDPAYIVSSEYSILVICSHDDGLDNPLVRLLSRPVKHHIADEIPF